MKIPNLFVPEISLEKKIKDFIKPDPKPKHVGEVIEQPADERKRKILLYFKDTIRLPKDGIYVWVRHPQSTSCFLELQSKSEFYDPHSEYDWFSSRNEEDKIKGKIKAHLTSDRARCKYLKRLVEKNNGVLLWEDDEKLLAFKKRKEEYEDQYQV